MFLGFKKMVGSGLDRSASYDSVHSSEGRSRPSPADVWHFNP